MSFPHDDPAWAETAAFLSQHLGRGQRLLAPDPFRFLFPQTVRFAEARGQAPSSFDWVVVHKGELTEVPRPLLLALPDAGVAVFANAVFVVWCAAPRIGLPDLGKSPHVRAYHANVAALPPETPPEMREGGADVTAVRVPEALRGTGPVTTVRPVWKPSPARAEAERQVVARYWLVRSPNGLPETLRERAFQEELDRLVEDAIAPAAGQRVLDIGCGQGRLAPFLQAAERVTGIDLDDAALARARARHEGLEGFDFLRMDAHRLGFADASFDTVLMLDVLEELRDPGAAIAEAARVLGRGGRLLLTAANKESLPLRALRRLALPLPGPAFSVAELTGMLRTVGLNVVRSDGLMLSPGWAIPGVDRGLGPLEEDPEFVEAARILGRRAGPEYALTFALMARKE